MDEIEVDGVIKNAFRLHGRIFGEIYNDRKKRFSDGADIHTSKVLREEGDLVYTRNSVYRVEFYKELENENHAAR